MKPKKAEHIEFEREWALVAGISGDQRTMSHVGEVLRAAGIRYGFEGSVVHDVWVERGKAETATALLRGERSKGWQILFEGDLDA